MKNPLKFYWDNKEVVLILSITILLLFMTLIILENLIEKYVL